MKSRIRRCLNVYNTELLLVLFFIIIFLRNCDEIFEGVADQMAIQLIRSLIFLFLVQLPEGQKSPECGSYPGRFTELLTKLV